VGRRPSGRGGQETVGEASTQEATICAEQPMVRAQKPASRCGQVFFAADTSSPVGPATSADWTNRREEPVKGGNKTAICLPRFGWWPRLHRRGCRGSTQRKTRRAASPRHSLAERTARESILELQKVDRGQKEGQFDSSHAGGGVGSDGGSARSIRGFVRIENSMNPGKPTTRNSLRGA
jgi:hypothetical protein